jgi:hypothetical protein
MTSPPSLQSPSKAFLIAALLCAATSAATAGEFLSPERMKAELGGFTIKGYYTADRVNFVEVYRKDGVISYKDDLKADAGQWFVRGQAFCTFYDKITGGCWYVIKRSDNCFEFHGAPHSGAPITREELENRKPQALAARDSDKVTCEVWFGA